MCACVSLTEPDIYWGVGEATEATFEKKNQSNKQLLKASSISSRATP